MPSKLVSRNVTVAGRRTSLRLEKATWDAFDQICDFENFSPHVLCTKIEEARNGTSRTSTVRAFVVSYFRRVANESGQPKLGSADKVLRAFSVG